MTMGGDASIKIRRACGWERVFGAGGDRSVLAIHPTFLFTFRGEVLLLWLKGCFFPEVRIPVGIVLSVVAI